MSAFFFSQGEVMRMVAGVGEAGFDHLESSRPTFGERAADVAHAAAVRGAEGLGAAIDTARKVGMLAKEAYFVGAAVGSAVVHAATDSVESWH